MNDFIDKLNDKETDSHCCPLCNDSGILYLYNKDGDVTTKPCPRCTEDEMSHIRSWGGQMFDG